MSRAVGIIETQGLPAAIEAADSMVKAAKVNIVDYKQIGSGLIAVIVQGDVGAVKAAVQAGQAAAEKIGKIIAVEVIPRPHEEAAKMLQSYYFSNEE